MEKKLLDLYKQLLEENNMLVKARGHGAITVEEERLDAQLCLIEQLLDEECLDIQGAS